MDLKIIGRLQKIFWVIGWSVLVLTGLIIGLEIYEFFRPVPESGFVWPKREFNLLVSIKLLFSSLAQAFFAFLVSAVFEMVFHRAPVRPQQAETFMRLTCLGFVGEGAVGVISWIISTVQSFSTFDVSTGPGILMTTTSLLSIFPSLILFVYAISIYVLFRHFSQMVSFEATVV